MRADPAHELAPQAPAPVAGVRGPAARPEPATSGPTGPEPAAPAVGMPAGPTDTGGAMPLAPAGSLTVSVVQRGGRPMSGVSARFPLDGGSIGRADHNRLVLVDMERTISRVHARLFPVDGHWMLHNQGSNSVRINGRLLTAGRELRLRDGDTLQIGPYLLRSRIDPLPGLGAPATRGEDAPTTVKVDHRGQTQTLPGSPAPTPTDLADETVIRPIPGATTAVPGTDDRLAAPTGEHGTGRSGGLPTGARPLSPPGPTALEEAAAGTGRTGAASARPPQAAAADGAVAAGRGAAPSAAEASPPPGGRLAAFRRLAQFALSPSAREALDSTQALPTELPTASRLDADAAAARGASPARPSGLRAGTSTSALGGPMSGAVIAPRPQPVAPPPDSEPVGAPAPAPRSAPATAAAAESAPSRMDAPVAGPRQTAEPGAVARPQRSGQDTASAAPVQAEPIGWFPGRQDDAGLELAAQALDEALGAALQAVWATAGARPADTDTALEVARETFARTLEARAAGLGQPVEPPPQRTPATGPQASPTAIPTMTAPAA